jgi:hypothetical protein
MLAPKSYRMPCLQFSQAARTSMVQPRLRKVEASERLSSI